MSPSSKKILFFGSSVVLVLFFLQFVTPVYTALFLAFALSPIMTWAKAHHKKSLTSKLARHD